MRGALLLLILLATPVAGQVYRGQATTSAVTGGTRTMTYSCTAAGVCAWQGT